MSIAHSCYIIKSVNTPYVYIGYTVNFTRRLRQHNREIKGGAKHTAKYYPFYPICVIKGFPDAYTAHSFEWHLQHFRHPRKRVYPRIKPILRNLENVIEIGGTVTDNVRMEWPNLEINWYVDGYNIHHIKVHNIKNYKINEPQAVEVSDE
jgi:structure-specific endonuclease subunit SLX1